MAPTGQASTQTPQSTQLSALTCALPLTMLIALLGHSLTQDSHPVHLSFLTSAGIQQPFQRTITTLYRERQDNSKIAAKHNPKFSMLPQKCAGPTCVTSRIWQSRNAVPVRPPRGLAVGSGAPAMGGGRATGGYGRTVVNSSTDGVVGRARTELAWSDLAMPRTSSFASCCPTQSRTGRKPSPEACARR